MKDDQPSQPELNDGPYRTNAKLAEELFPFNFRRGVSRVAVWMTRGVLFGGMSAGLVGACAGLVHECKAPEPKKPCEETSSLVDGENHDHHCYNGSHIALVEVAGKVMATCLCQGASQ